MEDVPQPQHQVLPPLTSLDLLHSSPFQQGASQVSSLSGGVGGSLMMYNSGDLRPSLWNVAPASVDNDDDMPFVVETAGEAQVDSTSRSSSYLEQSAALASFAQKCSAPTNRLKLFESTEERVSQDVSSLADQLADFKSFGASLHADKAADSESSPPPIAT